MKHNGSELCVVALIRNLILTTTLDRGDYAKPLLYAVYYHYYDNKFKY